jgi:penicillin G amidase
LKKALLVLAALLAAAALAAAWLIRGTFPRLRGTVRVAGHAAPVRIETDSRGVPTIRARSVDDAMYGLGYAHARDRLWQMEFQRRLGSGRLAEILGAGLVPADRFLRTVGFRRAAEASWPTLSASARRALEAYAAGVNAFVAADRARPIEFRIVRVSPEPWTPFDTLVWGKMMAWDLAGNARDEIRRARFVEAVGAERASQLLPLAGSSPTILTASEWPEPPAGKASATRTRPLPVPWGPLAAAFDSVEALGLAAGEDLGSNSWVLGGSRTASGKPILANDPHLGLRTPSVWYLASIDAPGLRATGATLPGVPGIVIGHNDRIAWGITSLEPDVQDLFVEEVDPKDPSRYRHRGEWRRFEERRETIRVRGAADIVLTVRSSVHGPIVTDAIEGAGRLGSAVALAWTGLDEGGGTIEAFFGLEASRNWGEFLAAARRIQAPAQNLVYADVDGHIGYAASGSMPVRPRADGLVPVPGAGEDDWAGRIAGDHLPFSFDPTPGFIVTANNRVVPSEPYPFGRTWAEPYRAARITGLLEGRDRLTPDDVATIQLDRVSLRARELLPLLVDTRPADAASRDALARLSDWNGDMAPDSVAAAIYSAWFDELAKMPEDELAGVKRGATRARFILDALRDRPEWCDDIRTPAVETCAAFKAAALARAVAKLRSRLGPDPSGWRWERLHRAVFPHDVFHEVPVLRGVFDLEVGQGGDGMTVNVGSVAQDGSFAMGDGPSYRQIVDLGALSRSRFVHTTGQSGNVFDRHYRDLLPEWRAGRYFEIGTEPAADVLILQSP